MVHENESVFVPPSTKHRLENPGRIPLEIIEVQNGKYLEEDDIVRFDDIYGPDIKDEPLSKTVLKGPMQRLCRILNINRGIVDD